MKTVSKTILVFLFVILSVITLLPYAFGQSSDLQVKSYSHYLDPTTHHYIIVGEVQNVGSTTITSASIYGSMQSSSNDSETANIAFSIILADHIAPGDTAPFYMVFTPDASSTGDFNWVTNGVTIAILQASFQAHTLLLALS
jgi:hypothetical protein